MNEKEIEIHESSFPEGYEKLRKIGKGAFGTAFLFRKTSNDTLVVVKEIIMSEMKASERQLALNEIQILKILDHRNIVSYYRNFEKDGTLFIEMEYAYGGTLAQYLSKQLEPMKEFHILFMFKQIVSPIQYVHSFNILHRDLKTANIFITKENVIKVGDFGISKIMTTVSQANSVVGTPYYISPEMCEGKEYNQKSDIWALGCILYEMTCLRKTFDGTNLPSLVKKIMKGKFQPVPVEYSPLLRQLIEDLLQKDPNSRPSAAVILHEKLPQLFNSEFGNPSAGQVSTLLKRQRSLQKSTKTKRSVLYEIVGSEELTSLIPIPLPPKITVKELAVSNTHFIALTTELEVYTWGEGGKGQLGHGMIVSWNENPRPVEMLRDKSIRTVSAEDGFSVFTSESGMIMTCGDGAFGCLGHGNWNDISHPKIVEKLLSLDIHAISCGDQHVWALSAEGDLYSWGRGLGGRLGAGHEKDCCSPNVVSVPDEMTVRRVRCGRDATVVITSDGDLLACGKNTFNKLGLSNRTFGSWFQIQNINKSLKLKRVTSVTEKVSDVSLGLHHTTIITAQGKIITMGSNSEGQRGIKNENPSLAPSNVNFPCDNVPMIVKSGPAFSITATMENEIYFWGTRHKSFEIPEVLNASTGTCNEYGSCHNLSRGSLPFLRRLNELEPVLEPKAILALYASARQIEKGETVNIKDIHTQQNRIFVLVDTTVPLVRKNNVQRRDFILSKLTTIFFIILFFKFRLDIAWRWSGVPTNVFFLFAFVIFFISLLFFLMLFFVIVSEMLLVPRLEANVANK